MAVHLKKSYQVLTEKVKMSVVIGDGQIGSSVIRLENQLLRMGDINDLEIGNGNDLIGKKLTVKSIVADVNDQTNYTSITYKLSGGKEEGNFKLEENVTNDGDSIIYRAEINFET